MHRYLTILLFLISGIRGYCQDYTRYVNPFIGTSNYGATHPGAVLPAGMASVVPFNVAFKKDEGNIFEKDSEWHSRTYVQENKYLTGYAHVNLSGVGCPELGSILLMPTTGPMELDPEEYGSTYSGETASAGYYSHQLTKYNIKTEATATLRTGLSRYTFPAGESHILLNLGLGLTNETGATVKIVSDTEVEGYKQIGTFCYNPEDVRPVYFVARFSKPAKAYGTWKKMPEYTAETKWTQYSNKYKPYPSYQYEMAGDNIGTYFSFETEEGEVIAVKIGISYVSIANARENLEAEQPAFAFEETVAAAKQKWNSLLKKAEVEGGSEDDKTIFYTALYHLLLHPNIFNDVNGEYPLMEQPGVGKTASNRYTVFSLWDTYRNVHPLLSLLYPELQSGMIQSMLGMYTESGWLPKWELLGMETNVMVGDPATPVIVDSWLRGIRDFDIELAYEAIRKSAMPHENGNKLRPGLQDYISKGYIPEGTDDVWGTVSTSLEYNIADWNLAQLAKSLKKKEDYQRFLKRSLSYRNYFDKSTGMLRPKMADGSWLTPFDPTAGANFEPVPGFVEGNAWQYRFYVPHDISGMVKLLGGPKKFIDELQRCFNEGHYDMANEPDITYAFLFNQVKGEEWQSQKKVRELIRRYYSNTPAGIPGNDDTGTLSAWLIYSMLGIYPHCPGDMNYSIVSPVFDRVTLHLDSNYYPGEKLIIETKKETADDLLIQEIRLNGKQHNSYFISHDELVRGGTLSYKLRGR